MAAAPFSNADNSATERRSGAGFARPDAPSRGATFPRQVSYTHRVRFGRHLEKTFFGEKNSSRKMFRADLLENGGGRFFCFTICFRGPLDLSNETE
jgi:hypothetical protein